MRRSRFIRVVTPQDRELLDAIIQTHPKPRIRRRAQAVVLSVSGSTIRDIAETYRVGYQTVHDWFDLFEMHGVRGLLGKPHPGAMPKADAAYREQLRRALSKSPRDLGYPSDVWSAARLRDHLAKLTGIEMSEDRVRLLRNRETSAQDR